MKEKSVIFFLSVFNSKKTRGYQYPISSCTPAIFAPIAI